MDSLLWKHRANSTRSKERLHSIGIRRAAREGFVLGFEVSDALGYVYIAKHLLGQLCAMLCFFLQSLLLGGCYGALVKDITTPLTSSARPRGPFPPFWFMSGTLVVCDLGSLQFLSKLR